MASLRNAIARFLGWMDAPRHRAHPDYSQPDYGSPASDDPSRAAFEEEIRRLLPPHNSADAASWDQYWDNQLAAGFASALYDIFLDDRALIPIMQDLAVHTVLCAGSGASLEPRALAAAGFDVLALDVSPRAFEIAERRRAGPDVMEAILDPATYRDGGKLTYVVGDLFNPELAPGPFDVVLERRMAQNYAEARFSLLLSGLRARLSPNGLFVTHCHDGRWRPPARRRHVTAEWWQSQGGVLWSGVGPKPKGQVAWPITTTG